MKSSWSHPSLSRDFALLAAAILCVLFFISAWVSYTTYTKHSAQVSHTLEQESAHIEYMLQQEIEDAGYMLTSLGRQIILDKNNELLAIAKILKSFDSRGHLYSAFSYINNQEKVIVSSNRGVLDVPVNVADRDYVKLAAEDPWKPHIGQPIEGRVSGRWVIPVALGITDYTGKFIGSLVISLDISVLTDKINHVAKRDGISFAIISNTLLPLTQVSNDQDFVAHYFPPDTLRKINFSSTPQGMISQGNLFLGSSLYRYYYVLKDYPYIILLGYDSFESDSNVRNQLWSRILQLLGFASFFVLFLWIMRIRMIRPIIQLTHVAENIAKGTPYIHTPQGNPEEIEGLSTQMGRISEYIHETTRIEDELRNKMFMLKKGKELADLDNQSKTEFLAYICQELRTPLNSVIGFAQLMKDQLYGPIENRKYRQCATDIYQTSNNILSNLNDLLAFSRAETHYHSTNITAVDAAHIVKKSIQSLEDKLAIEKKTISVSLQDKLPKLMIDEFKLLQVITNVLQFLLADENVENLNIDIRLASEAKERLFFVFLIGHEKPSATLINKLHVLAERAIEDSHSTRQNESNWEIENLNLRLARVLAAEHHAGLDIHTSTDGSKQAIIAFSHDHIEREL